MIIVYDILLQIHEYPTSSTPNCFCRSSSVSPAERSGSDNGNASRNNTAAFLRTGMKNIGIIIKSGYNLRGLQRDGISNEQYLYMI